MWLSQSRDQAVPACPRLQRQGINTTDVTLLPLLSAGRRQKVKKRSTQEDSGVSCLCHLLSASFTFASSLSGFTAFPQIFPSYN